MSNFQLRTIYPKLRDENGSQSVEFALSMLVLFTLMFGIMDFSRVIYSFHYATYAAQEGARYAIVRGAGWKTSCSTSAPPNFTLNYGCIASQSDVQNYVKNLALPGIDRSKVSVTAAWPGTTPDCSSGCVACATPGKRGCLVKVKVSYNFGFIFPFMPKSALACTATSEKVVQH